MRTDVPVNSLFMGFFTTSWPREGSDRDLLKIGSLREVTSQLESNWEPTELESHYC
jgi:hypothetical protein